MFTCDNNILLILTKSVQKYIWDSKLRKALPHLDLAIFITKDELRMYSKFSREVRTYIQKCDLAVVRDF